MFPLGRGVGNSVLIREDTRAVWGLTLGSTAAAGNLREVARGLHRSPGFAAVVAAGLGLGIGASTAVFSFVHAVLLPALPARDPGELVTMHIHVREMEDRFPAFPCQPPDA